MSLENIVALFPPPLYEEKSLKFNKLKRSFYAAPTGTEEQHRIPDLDAGCMQEVDFYQTHENKFNPL